MDNLFWESTACNVLLRDKCTDDQFLLQKLIKTFFGDMPIENKMPREYIIVHESQWTEKTTNFSFKAIKYYFYSRKELVFFKYSILLDF